MNNILKKNIIKKEDAASTTLPHITPYDVAVKTNQIVHAALNYALQKLVDNDLYIEKKLIYESNYVIGPTKKGDDISYYADNTKFFDGVDNVENNLSVVQKIPYDLTATISSTLDLSVQFLHDSVCYLATTTYGIYKSTDNMNSWKKLDGVEGLPTGNYNVKYLQNNYENVVFNTSDAIYKIEKIEGLVNPEMDAPSCMQIFGKVQRNGREETNSIAALSGNSLFIGNTAGLYCVTKRNSEGLYYDPIKENTITGNVTDVKFLSDEHDNGKILVGVNSQRPGLYESNKQYSFYNIALNTAMSEIQYANEIDDMLYVASGNGLSCLGTDGVLKAVSGLATHRINKIVKIDDGDTEGVYACTNHGIWQLTTTSSGVAAHQIMTAFQTSVIDMCYANGMVVVANQLKVSWAESKIHDIDDHTYWTENSNFGNQIIVGLVPQLTNAVVYTQNCIFTLDMGLGKSSHVENTLSAMFVDKPDVTTVYFDDDDTILIGTAEGLFDENFNYVRFAVNALDDTEVYITATVNKVRYIELFGKSIWCICTSNGAYMLQKNDYASSVKWSLNGLHILQGKNIADIVYDSTNNAIVAASGNKLYCLVMSDSIMSDTYNQATYITDDENYSVNELDSAVKTLASFAGKIIVLKDNAQKQVTALETFSNFSGKFTKTRYLQDKTVADINRLQTFVTNSYDVETYARTTGSDIAIYKLVLPIVEGDAEFTKIVPDMSVLSSKYDKAEIALAYRHLINPTEATIPKSVRLLPSDRFSQVMLVSTNDNKISAYDIYDMKIDKYDDAYAHSTNPVDVYNELHLGYTDARDNVKASIVNVGSAPVKDINYFVDTSTVDIVDQQHNMKCLVATEDKLKIATPSFKSQESLKFENISNSGSAEEQDEMTQFSLIPYAFKIAEGEYERKYVYIGISQSMLWKYFEGKDDSCDFDLGYMQKVQNITINNVATAADVAFYAYDFSYDNPFNNTMAELQSKYENTPSVVGGAAKFIMFATSEGPLAAVVNYGDPESQYSWFSNFTKIPGIPDSELVTHVCRLGNFMYAATDNKVYKLDITTCKLNELGQINTYNVSFREITEYEFISIQKLIAIGNDIYVLGQYQSAGNYSLTRITNSGGSSGTTRITLAATADVVPVPNSTKAIVKNISNDLSVLDITAGSSYSYSFSTLSTEMQYNSIVQEEIVSSWLSTPGKTPETAELTDYAQTTTTVQSPVVLSGIFPCSADRVFTQYDYVKNKNYVYFATSWHKVYNSYYIPEYSQYSKISVDLSGLVKYDGTYSDLEFDFKDVLQYDNEGHIIPDDTMVDTSNGEVKNGTVLYLIRPADDKTDADIDMYGITQMFFTKSGEIYSGSFGFDIEQLADQLRNVENGYSVEDLALPTGTKINCLDAITVSKTNFNVSIVALGTTKGLRIKLPGSAIFAEFAVLDNHDLFDLVNGDIRKIALSENSMLFISNVTTGSTTASTIVNIPYEVNVLGSINFIESKATFNSIKNGVVANDVFILENENSTRGDAGYSFDVEHMLVPVAAGGIYSPTYDVGIKNEEQFAKNVSMLYPHELGMFLASGNSLSTYTNAEDITEYKTINAQHGIQFIYENSKSSEIYYGSSAGVYVIDVVENFDTHTISYVENEFDKTANSLLSSLSVESMYRYNGDSYYEIVKEVDGSVQHNIVKLAKDRVEDIITVNDTNRIFITTTYLKNVFNYSDTQLFAACTKPVIVDMLTKTAEEFVTNITPEQDLVYFKKIRQAEIAITIAMQADGSSKYKMYYRSNNKQQFQEIYPQIAIDDADVEKITAENIVLLTDKYVIDSINGIFKYGSLDYVRYYNRLLTFAVNCITQIDDHTALVGTSNGLYKYVNGNILQCNALVKKPISAISLAEAHDDGTATYFLTSGAKVYKTKDASLITAEQLFDLAEYNSEITAITSVKKFGRKSYVFATNVGIFNTYDRFYLVDTWSKQNTAGISQKIKESYNQFIQKHIAEWHGPNSLVTTANSSIMPIDMSEMPSDWQKTSKDKCIIENDYVDSIEFSGDIKYVTAEYANFTTPYNSTLSSNDYQSIDGISYILKTYKSNMKELYIYLPTTGTQYVNHVKGMQYCSNNTYAFTRSNSTSAVCGTVEELKTKVRVKIDASHFDFGEVYNVFINGNSLPLKIFTDKDKHDINESQQYFHSYMEPSIANTMPALPTINDTDKLSHQNIIDGKMYFDFSCFGTDAQSIKIIAKSPYKYKVIFDANGANSGQMEDLVLKEDEKAKLPTCNYIKDGYMFKGWSLSKNGSAAYTNMQEVINLAAVNNAVVTLYAVWEYYLFDVTSDTVLTLKSTHNEFMLADSEPAEGCSNVIVDYDYVGDTRIVLKSNGKMFTIASGENTPDSTSLIIECED